MRRASHQVLDPPIVYEDPLALAIIGKRRADLARSGDPRELGGLERSLRAFLAARSRYARRTEDLGPAEIKARYFAGRSEGFAVRRMGHLVRAER